MSLSTELERAKYDKRLLEWHVSRGQISKDEFNKYLSSLPDLAHNVEPFSLGHDDSSVEEDEVQGTPYGG